MDDHQQQQPIISNGSKDFHQPPQSSSQSFDQSMPSFTENSIGDVTMESVRSPSIQSPGVGHQDGSEQARIADGAPIPIASKKRKRAEIAPSELRDLGLLPASRHASPSQSRSGSRAASPAIASTSSNQINTNPSRDKSSAKKSSRNIDRVFFGAYEIKTWYYSPYPFEEEDWLAFNPSTKPEENRTNLSRRSSGKASESNLGGGGGKSSNKRAGSESSAASPSISNFNHSTHDLPTSSSSIGGALGSSVHEAPVLSNSVDNTKSNPSTNDIAKDRKSERKMWVCDGCFKYMRSYAGWNSHKKQCTFTHPPGKKVYQRGAHIIWEVDGAQAKLYAQNLSLFGKLFIDHKTIYFDAEPFTFYVLTDATTQFDHALGYFSKEKVSYDDYNLACIITFPPFQQKGFGTLMIEFSYYLSSLTDIPGTPERPLSDLGLKGYLSFWSSVVLRTLVIAFNDIESPSICLPYVGNKLQSSNAPASVEKLRIECLRIRRILLGLPPLSEEILKNKSQRKNSESNQDGMLVNGEEKPKRHSYGWAGEIKRLPSSSSSSSSSISLDSRHLPSSSQNQISASTTSSPSSSSTTANQSNPNASSRTLRTRSDKGKEKAESLSPPPPISNINSTSQLLDLDGETMGSFQLRTNLERIAEATNLRLEDCSQALMECGLMSWKIPHENGAYENGIGNGIDRGGDGEGDLTLLISLDKVREGIRKKGVKRQMLDVNYVL